jgi:hypothetical protein
MEWKVFISTDPAYWGTTSQKDTAAIAYRAAEILATWITDVFGGEGVVAHVGSGP